MKPRRRRARSGIKSRYRPAPQPADANDAWQTLSLLLELVKHAEAKATTVLASASVLGGLLYALIERLEKAHTIVIIATAISAGATVVSGLSAGTALHPRARIPEPLPGLLFYRSIVQRFPSDANGYTREFSRLLAKPELLLVALSHEIWHNADVATKKYRAANVAVTTLLTALASTAMTGVLRVLVE